MFDELLCHQGRSINSEPWYVIEVRVKSNHFVFLKENQKNIPACNHATKLQIR